MWPLIKLVPKQTNFKFVSVAAVMAVISLALIVGSFVSIFTKGFNLGVDFKGGTVLEVRTAQPLDLERLRQTMESQNLGDVNIQNFTETATAALIRFESPAASDPAKVVDQVKAQIRTAFPGATFPRTEVVGPKVSGELMRGGLLALAGALSLMMIYIWFRFEWQFGLGAVLALAHDVILTLGMFSFFQIEFDLTIIAALLTIIGYSMNDTVVVFDRLRENLRKFKKRSLGELIDLSTNETLSRTIITGLTALMALTALMYLGGPTLFGFALAMIFGVVVGTYSSVYIGTPVILIWGVKRGEVQEVIPPGGTSAAKAP
jgi:preprotein translocase SecF subunit